MKFQSLGALASVALILGSVSAQAAALNPEFKLVQGLFAISGEDLTSSQGRALYQRQVTGLVQSYAANHTADPQAAMNNITGAFQTLGIPQQEVAQVQAVNARYSQSLASAQTMSSAQSQEFWKSYTTDLTTSLSSIPYPEGDQFSACQISLGIMTLGLAIGIPSLVYSIGEGMGDQNAPAIISIGGSLMFLVGLGGGIAALPTCL